MTDVTDRWTHRREGGNSSLYNNKNRVHHFQFLSLFHHGQVETSQDWLHRPITPWSIRNMQNSIVTNFIIVKYKLAF